MSVWQTPQATRRTSTSPALGSCEVDFLHDERLPELLQHRSAHPHVFALRVDQCLTAGTLLARAQRHPEAGRAHREAEALARLGARGLPL